MKINQKKYKQGEEFVKALIHLKNYIETENRKDLGTDIDRFIFSMLVMFDGDSGINDFKFIDLGFNKEYYLHELYCALRAENEDK